MLKFIGQLPGSMAVATWSFEAACVPTYHLSQLAASRDLWSSRHEFWRSRLQDEHPGESDPCLMCSLLTDISGMKFHLC